MPEWLVDVAAIVALVAMAAFIVVQAWRDFYRGRR